MSQTVIRILFCLAILLVLMIAPSINAQVTVDNIWHSATGKHQTEAEFVQLKDNKVQLRLVKTKQLIWVELEKLSKADRTKAKLLQHNLEFSPEELLKSMKVSVELDTTTNSPVTPLTARRPVSKLKISVIARGKAADHAIRIGDYRLTKLTDGNGKPGFDASRKSLEEIAEFKRWDTMLDIDLLTPERALSTRHPSGGVYIDVKWSSSIPQTIGEISGHFHIHTGGTRTRFRIEEANWRSGKEIQHEALRAAGLSVSLLELRKKGSKRFHPRFRTEGEFENLLLMYFGNRRGGIHKLATGRGYTKAQMYRTDHFRFNSNRLPNDAVLYMETVIDPVVLKVPFKFENLSVPRRPNEKIEYP